MYIYSEHQTTEITNGAEVNGLCKPEDENTTDKELFGIPEFNQTNQVGVITFCGHWVAKIQQTKIAVTNI